jgi:hypothetical protein
MSAPILHACEAQDLFCNSFRAYAPGLCPPFVAGYSVAITVTIPIAEVDPLPAIIGPYLLPAPPITVVVAHGKRRTKKRKVAEMVVPEEDAVLEREVVESVAGETLASKGCASKAPCSGHKRAPISSSRSLSRNYWPASRLSPAIFGALVFALLGYVYWSTTSYVRSRSDHALTTELTILQRAYAVAGRNGLITTISQRLADQRFEGGAYLLADSSFAPLAGNLADWPPAMKGSSGWGNFSAREGRPMLRSTFATLPDGSHLLVGKDIDDLDEFAAKIKAAVALCIVLILVHAGVASVSVTRRTGAHRSYQRDQPRHHAKRPRSANTPARDTRRVG